MKFEDRRPKATDIHKALADWFPSGYSRSREDFEAAVKAASGAALDWAGLGAQLSAERLMVEGSPRLLMQHVKLAEAPQWFKVGGRGWFFPARRLRCQAPPRATRGSSSALPVPPPTFERAQNP